MFFLDNFDEGLLYDTALDSNSLVPNFSDTWVPNNPDGLFEMTDNITAQTNAWRDKPPNAWKSNDVCHWICNTATQHNINYEEIKLETFSDVSTESFRNMAVDDFIHLCESSEDGRFLYESKEALYSNHQFNYQHEISSFSTCPEEGLSRLSSSSNEESSSSETQGRKGRGRPRSSHTIRRKPVKRLGKLWEFLRNLLLNNETCPSLIKWDNYKEGTFKFVQSEQVARLWGDRKENKNMNYEKLSRAMRYYYRSKVLLPVAGKRLVYKFGPEAKGWRTENPILENRPEMNV